MELAASPVSLIAADCTMEGVRARGGGGGMAAELVVLARTTASKDGAGSGGMCVEGGTFRGVPRTNPLDVFLG